MDRVLSSHDEATRVVEPGETRSRARTMGAAGRARVLEEFQLNMMIDRYEATHQELVSRRMVAR